MNHFVRFLFPYLKRCDREFNLNGAMLSMEREISMAKRDAVRRLYYAVNKPSPISIEEANHMGAQQLRKERMDYMHKIFCLRNPKYHSHLTEELDIHSRNGAVTNDKKVGAMTIDNLNILVGAHVDIKRVLKLWNASSEEKKKYKFSELDFTRAAFQKWLNRRAW